MLSNFHKVFKVVVNLVVWVILSILDVSLQVEHGLNGSIDCHYDHVVNSKAKEEVAAKEVNEHVVVNMDLVLGGHEIKNGDDRHAIVHACVHVR